MSNNPLINITSALYGAPGHIIVDVTEKIQSLFDEQFNSNNNLQQFTLSNIGPELFSIPDPAPFVIKTFTIQYVLLQATSGRIFARGTQDGGSLQLTATPLRDINILQAMYATPVGGLDVTDKLNAYLSDPSQDSTIIVGSQQFLNALTSGVDPAFGIRKSFGVIYSHASNPGTIYRLVGNDGQSVTFV